MALRTDGTDNSETIHGIDTVGGAFEEIFGHGGDDTIFGHGGIDFIIGGAGADAMDGGDGNDWASYGHSPTAVIVSLAAGRGSKGDAEGDTLTNIENLGGSDYGDILIGDGGNNILQGQEGNDTLMGGEGIDTLYGNHDNDTLKGGGGADILVGGSGDDMYYVENAGDAITELGGAGFDEARASVSYALTAGADVEILRTTSAAATTAINLTGNANGNSVIGNNGANVLNGGDGNDELTGLGGQDTFLFNTALDTAFNVDTITDFNVADDTIRLDDDIFSSGLSANNSVAGSQFVIGAAALDAGDRIIYNAATGAVYYDSDGTGAAAAVQFAQLAPGLALTNFDFFVVA